MKSSLVRGVLALMLTVPACAPVEPWQRGYLARPEMQFEADPLLAKARQHVYTSREAAAGGHGVGGGGCGCN